MTWSEQTSQDNPAPAGSDGSVPDGSAAREPGSGETVPTEPATEPVTGRGAPTPVTGDEQVDGALAQLDGAADEPLSTQIEAAEHVHEVLQGRLSDLGDG